MSHTPAPWDVEWYECRANKEDVEAGTAAQVGDVLWRVPVTIGPVAVGENHWSGAFLDVTEEDAHLIAAAPELLEALKALEAAVRNNKFYAVTCAFDGGYASAAIAKAEGK